MLHRVHQVHHDVDIGRASAIEQVAVAGPAAVGVGIPHDRLKRVAHGLKEAGLGHARHALEADDVDITVLLLLGKTRARVDTRDGEGAAEGRDVGKRAKHGMRQR